MAKFESFGSVISGGSVVATIPVTSAVYVKTTGVVEVAGRDTGIVNLGTIVAGTLLEIGVKQIGTNTTASLIPLR